MKTKPPIIKTNVISKFVIPMTTSPMHDNNPSKFFDNDDDLEARSNDDNTHNHVCLFCLSTHGINEDYRGSVIYEYFCIIVVTIVTIIVTIVTMIIVIIIIIVAIIIIIIDYHYNYHYYYCRNFYRKNKFKCLGIVLVIIILVVVSRKHTNKKW